MTFKSKYVNLAIGLDVMLLVRNEKVSWSVPLNIDKFAIFYYFIKQIKDIDNTNPIKSFFFGINCKWNQNHCYENLDFKLINNYFKFCNENIYCYNNFSEYNLTDEDLKDEKSNFLLDLTIQNKGFAEISSDKLYKHIKSRYPNAKIIASVEKSFNELEDGKEVEFYNSLLDKYDRVVLSPVFVRKDSFFKDIEKIKDVERLEIIVNERNNKNDLLNKENEATKIPINFKEVYENSLSLSNEEIDDIFNKTGIKNFRIIGDNLKNYEYIFLIANYILKKFGNTPFFIYLTKLCIMKEENEII